MTFGSNAYLDVQRGSQDDLVITHAPLVKRLAYHLANRLPPSVEIDDLVQIGMIGLLEAANSYEPGKGANFETYASIKIRGAMLDQVRKNDWCPRAMPKKMREISQAIHSIENRLGREATAQDVIDETGMTSEEYHQVLLDSVSTKLFSFEQGATGEQGFDVVDNNGETPLELTEQSGFKEALTEQIGNLPEREKMVISLYYDEELNFKEIGEVLEVSESRISQIHGQAMLRIKGRLSEWTQREY